MRLLLTAIAITAIFLYCRKDDKEEPSFTGFLHCTDDQPTDSTLLADSITGTWKLINQACPMGTEKIKKVIVTFTAARTYEISEDDAIIGQGSWHFTPWGSGWSITTSTRSNYFIGSVSFCEGKLVFSGLPVDACNHYFSRIF